MSLQVGCEHSSWERSFAFCVQQRHLNKCITHSVQRSSDWRATCQRLRELHHAVVDFSKSPFAFSQIKDPCLNTWLICGQCRHCQRGYTFCICCVTWKITSWMWAVLFMESAVLNAAETAFDMLQETCSRRQPQQVLYRRWPTARAGWTSLQALQLKAGSSLWSRWPQRGLCPCALLLQGHSVIWPWPPHTTRSDRPTQHGVAVKLTATAGTCALLY